MKVEALGMTHDMISLEDTRACYLCHVILHQEFDDLWARNGYPCEGDIDGTLISNFLTLDL